MEEPTPVIKASVDPFLSSWRIFPPPNANPRRTKKRKRNAKRKQLPTTDANQQNATDISAKEEGTIRTNPHDKIPQAGKELWRQKQQQYQYTYPYQVGETIRMLVPSQRSRFKFTNELEVKTHSSDFLDPNNIKFQKLTQDGFKITESESAKSSNSTGNTTGNTNGNTNGSNQLVADFATVDNIVPLADKSEGNAIHVTRQSDQKTVILSPKDQRKLLSPDLTTKNTCTVVLVEETLPFRHVSRLHLDGKTRDRVLEIGCSTGELSKLIWKNHLDHPIGVTFKSWIGMDNSQEMIDRCKEQLGEYKSMQPFGDQYASKVVKVDTLEEPKRAFKEAITPTDTFGPSPTVVLIDIGGNRECGPVVKTITWVLEAFGTDLRMVIVKSRALVRQLRSDTERVPNPEDNEGIPALDASTGIISGGAEWFKTTHRRFRSEKRNRFEQRFKHPLKAPKVVSPVDGITPICRYHNYHKDGCKLHNDRETLGRKCLLDHDYCHSCMKKGHVARNCPDRDTQSCY